MACTAQSPGLLTPAINSVSNPLASRQRNDCDQGVPPVKAAYAAALRACEKGAEWKRGTELFDNYLEVRRLFLNKESPLRDAIFVVVANLESMYVCMYGHHI